jgi:nucleoside-diphosphate-sugar epimerase
MTVKKLFRFGSAKLLKNFSWRGSAPRMAVDVVLINLSVVSAFLLWFAVYIVFVPNVDSRNLTRTFRLFYLDNFLFLSFVFLVTFACYGFYNQARRYENRYKMVVVAQAVTVALSAYTFLEYFLFRADLIPRGVAVLIWGLIFLTIGGARLAKSWVSRRFRLVPVQPGKSKKIRNVLVIGGGGYIGSILVHRLLAANYRVRVLDSLLYGDNALRDLGHHPGYELIVGDFRNVEAVVRACQGMDAVVHLGAIVGDPACALEPRLTTEINFAATKMVMEICKGYGISRFLFASTCSVYGATENLVDEQSPVNPVSLYAATKLDSERVILNTDGKDFHPSILRLATAFGSSYRQRFDLVVNLLTVKALTEKKITIYNGAQWRPFIHIHDIARAFILCLEAPLEKVSRQLFNVGSYQMNFTLREVGEIIRGQVPDVEIEYIENQDKRNYRVSFDKIHAVLGFTCEKSILDGVSEIQRAYEQNLIGDYREKRYSNQQYLSSAAELADQNEPHPAPLSLEFVRKLSLEAE